jgi:hypothetical protein
MVKRYTTKFDETEIPDGDYVTARDYDLLAAQFAELQERHKRIGVAQCQAEAYYIARIKAIEIERDRLLCSDCPPIGYPTDETRCSACPRRSDSEGK